LGFEESALERLRRYREGADRTIGLCREAEDEAHRFAERLFAGLERVAGIAREAGFGVEAGREDGLLILRLEAGPGAASEACFGAPPGAAAETDEDLMHEELSRYVLVPSGYSGRVLGWSPNVPGEGPCQTFAVYRDGVWKTKGVFVEKARGGADDPDDVLGGFCLRILGRLVDLAAPVESAGRRWAAGPYAPGDLLGGERPPVETRWLR
jgi:hypothetical protein